MKSIEEILEEWLNVCDTGPEGEWVVWYGSELSEHPGRVYSLGITNDDGDLAIAEFDFDDFDEEEQAANATKIVLSSIALPRAIKALETALCSLDEMYAYTDDYYIQNGLAIYREQIQRILNGEEGE